MAGWTIPEPLDPLEEAVASCDVAAVSMLIKSGSNVNPVIDDGFPPLHVLVDVGEPHRQDALQIAAMLLDAGVDIEQRGINDWTPLHRAANAGNMEMVQLFVERGADVNARTRIDEHETPLMEAASSGRVSVLIYLLEHGADPGLLDSCGETAEEIAVRQLQTAAADILRAYRNHHC